MARMVEPVSGPSLESDEILPSLKNACDYLVATSPEHSSRPQCRAQMLEPMGLVQVCDTLVRAHWLKHLCSALRPAAVLWTSSD